MSAEKIVDARGLSCPEPILVTKNAVREYGKAAFSVQVSSPTARDNVNRWLQGEGRSIAVKEEGVGWLIEVAAQ